MLFERQVLFHSRVVFYYDSLAGFFGGFFIGIVVSFLPVIARRLGANNGQMALISSSFSIGLMLTFLWTYLTIRGKKMTAFYWSKILGCSLFFLMPFVATPVFFVAIVFLYYLLDSAGNPAYGAIMKEVYPDRQRAMTMGYTRIVASIATVVASFMGGRLLDWWGMESYKIVFPAGAIMGILAINTFARIPLKKEKKVHQYPSLIQMLKDWLNDRTIWKFISIISIAGFGNLIMGPIAPIFLVDTLKVSMAFVGLMGAVSSAALIFSYYMWGAFIDRKGPMPSVRISFLIISLMPLLYIIGTKWSVLLAVILFSLGVGGWELAWFKYICAVAGSPEKAHIYTGFYYNLMGLRGIIAPFVAVWLMKVCGVKMTFFVSFLIIISGFVLASILWRKELLASKEIMAQLKT